MIQITYTAITDSGTTQKTTMYWNGSIFTPIESAVKTINKKAIIAWLEENAAAVNMWPEEYDFKVKKS